MINFNESGTNTDLSALKLSTYLSDSLSDLRDTRTFCLPPNFSHVEVFMVQILLPISRQISAATWRCLPPNICHVKWKTVIFFFFHFLLPAIHLITIQLRQGLAHMNIIIVIHHGGGDQHPLQQVSSRSGRMGETGRSSTDCRAGMSVTHCPTRSESIGYWATTSKEKGCIHQFTN